MNTADGRMYTNGNTEAYCHTSINAGIASFFGKNVPARRTDAHIATYGGGLFLKNGENACFALQNR